MYSLKNKIFAASLFTSSVQKLCFCLQVLNDLLWASTWCTAQLVKNLVMDWPCLNTNAPQGLNHIAGATSYSSLLGYSTLVWLAQRQIFKIGLQIALEDTASGISWVTDFFIMKGQEGAGWGKQIKLYWSLEYWSIILNAFLTIPVNTQWQKKSNTM